jgi:hypothetical protein
MSKLLKYDPCISEYFVFHISYMYIYFYIFFVIFHIFMLHVVLIFCKCQAYHLPGISTVYCFYMVYWVFIQDICICFMYFYMFHIFYNVESIYYAPCISVYPKYFYFIFLYGPCMKFYMVHLFLYVMCIFMFLYVPYI